MDDVIFRQAAVEAIKSLYPDKPKINFMDNFSNWEEKNKQYIECEQTISNLPSAHSEHECKNCIFSAFKQFQPKWIPVTERLPKPNEKDEDGIQKYYLIQNEFGDMMVAAYREKNLGDTWWEQMYVYKPIEDKVIAYMPLPKRYERSEDD